MPDDKQGQHQKLIGLYEGPIVDNKDPKKRGRVRVNIPGVAEPTGWARPLGNPGAGGKKRGGWAPPPIGAEVGVMFKMGDPDHPRFFPGFPGDGEAPDEVTDDATTPEDAVKVVYVFEGARYKIVLDERPGKVRAAIEDKKTGDMYEIDGVKLGLKLKSTAGMSIECTGALDIRASSVTINGRKIAPSTKPL